MTTVSRYLFTLRSSLVLQSDRPSLIHGRGIETDWLVPTGFDGLCLRKWSTNPSCWRGHV
jgi:hypothetical protein